VARAPALRTVINRITELTKNAIDTFGAQPEVETESALELAARGRGCVETPSWRNFGGPSTIGTIQKIDA